MNTMIFDFDYTLADSSKGVIECVRYALDSVKGYKNDDMIRETIGMSLDDAYFFLTADTDKGLRHRFINSFYTKANKVMAKNTVLFENTAEAVEKLHTKGIRLGICSTKFRYRIQEILEREKLDSFFDIIVGGEDVKELKPAPEGLLKIIDKFQLDSNDVYYVGDTTIDAETAQNAKVKFIASLTGVTKKESFKDYKVDRFITDILDLV